MSGFTVSNVHAVPLHSRLLPLAISISSTPPPVLLPMLVLLLFRLFRLRHNWSFHTDGGAQPRSPIVIRGSKSFHLSLCPAEIGSIVNCESNLSTCSGFTALEITYCRMSTESKSSRWTTLALFTSSPSSSSAVCWTATKVGFFGG